MQSIIPVTKAYLPSKEEYLKKLDTIWESHILTNMGTLHREFEEKLTSLMGGVFCLAFANCSKHYMIQEFAFCFYSFCLECYERSQHLVALLG